MTSDPDFNRQQFSDLREQITALREQLTHDTQSLTAQIRSLTASINSSSTEVLVRLTAIEGWQSARERLDEAKYEAVEVQNLQREAEISELAKQLGEHMGKTGEAQKKLAADLAVIQTAYEQAKGASYFWKWLVGLGGAILVLLNIAHMTRR